MALNWINMKGGGWLPFQTFNIANVTDYGIYIIWYNGNPGRVVYVGQGDIKGRLTSHRSDARILKYADRKLLVTWASVSTAQVDGVERHLADTWHPLVGDAHPDVRPIAVNSPW